MFFYGYSILQIYNFFLFVTLFFGYTPPQHSIHVEDVATIIRETPPTIQGIDASTQQYVSCIDKGLLYFSQGKYEQAIEELKKALQYKPNDVWAKYYITMSQTQLGYQEFEYLDYYESYQLLKKAAENTAFKGKTFSGGQYVLGILEVIGKKGVDKNYKSGVQWLKLACSNGHLGAEQALNRLNIFSCN